MFCRQAEYRTQLEHLVSMAQRQEFKAHAWAQAQMLDSEDSGLYQGIAADLKTAMDGPGKAAASEHLRTEKHR